MCCQCFPKPGDTEWVNFISELFFPAGLWPARCEDQPRGTARAWCSCQEPVPLCKLAWGGRAGCLQHHIRGGDGRFPALPPWVPYCRTAAWHPLAVAGACVLHRLPFWTGKLRQLPGCSGSVVPAVAAAEG